MGAKPVRVDPLGGLRDYCQESGLLEGYTPGPSPLPPSFQLLGEDRFQDIEKIKTIGSTYMAVSGLSPEKQVKALFGLNHSLWQGPASVTSLKALQPPSPGDLGAGREKL